VFAGQIMQALYGFEIKYRNFECDF